MTRPPLALIAGPTASGKSALALRLAELSGGTVINADASQVYRDLRVLTARPSIEDERQVRHRLFGHIDGAEACSAARWADEARREVTSAHDAGRLPILVGGTGLYIRTLLDGIAPVPDIDETVRPAVRALPIAAAYAALVHEDPVAATRLSPGDTQRVSRALEVVRSTGRPLAEWQRDRTGGIGESVTLAPLVILPDRAALVARCDARAAAMFDEGAIEEVAALLARTDLPADVPIRGAIGVREIMRHIAGHATRAEALEAVQLATRRYAKRQMTWFRHQMPAHWPRITQFNWRLCTLQSMFGV